MVEKKAIKIQQKSVDKVTAQPDRSSPEIEAAVPEKILDKELQNFISAPNQGNASPRQILKLQRMVSNRAVTRLLGTFQGEKGPAGAAVVQPVIENRAPAALQRADDVNTISQPQTAQAPLDLKDQYAYRYVYRNLPEADVKAISKDVLTAELPQAITLTKNDPNDPYNPPQADADKVLTAYKNQVDLAPYDKSFTAYLNTWNDASISAVPSRFTLINHLFNRFKTQFIPAVRSKYKRLDRELDERVKKLSTKVGKIPDEATRKKFAAALKSLPGFKEVIKEIKTGGSVKKAAPVIGKKEVTWQDGGTLLDKIVKRPAEANESTATDTDAEFKTLKENIQKADNFYRALVEPDVLEKIKRPTVVYHLVNSYDRVGANQDTSMKNSYTANQSGTEVHFGQGVFPHIIIHEIGHYIEDNLPRDKWLDIQLLLQSRHAEAGGGALVAGPGGARQKGSYPATGEYTSRAYTTGTEVSSMTLENLAQAANMDDLIEKDPQQVAVVIRALRPTAYAEYQDLRKYDDLLP